MSNSAVGAGDAARKYATQKYLKSRATRKAVKYVPRKKLNPVLGIASGGFTRSPEQLEARRLEYFLRTKGGNYDKMMRGEADG